MKHLNDEQLLEEAYRKYPIGTIFKSIFVDGGDERKVIPYHSKDICMSYKVKPNGNGAFTGKRTIYVQGGMECQGSCGTSNPTLYVEGKGWCPIIGENFNYEMY